MNDMSGGRGGSSISSSESLSDTAWDDIDSPTNADQEHNDDWGALCGTTGNELGLPVLERQNSFEILSEQDVVLRSQVLKDRVVEQLSVNANEASTLLRYYRWNVQQLLDDWLDDSDKVRINIGLGQLLNEHVECVDTTFWCALCLEERLMSHTMAMSCGHRYCKQCWCKWINAEFDKGPMAVFTVCPAVKCKIILHESFIDSLLEEKKRSQFYQWLLDSFVQGNRHLKWCPSPDCHRVAEYKSGGEKEITCRCGHVFCFKCLLEGHRPCSCNVAMMWNKKNSQDSENVNWILANTKRCPKCTVNIEKNQGCNHMTCRNCKFEFCWLCKGEWKKHGSATGGFYRCNKYEDVKISGDDSIAVNEEMKAKEARTALQKYMFYFTRFDNHQKSIAFAKMTRRKAETRMQRMRDIQGTNYQDVQFVLNAVNAVIACRRVLMWTYAYGFYLEVALEKQIFEQHQERLEKFTEHLHGLSEKPTEDLLDIKTRAEIVNYTRVSLRYRENVLSAIDDGLKSACLS